MGILGGALVGGGIGVAVDNANGNCYSLSVLKVVGVYNEHEGIPEEARQIHGKAAQRQAPKTVAGKNGHLLVSDEVKPFRKGINGNPRDEAREAMEDAFLTAKNADDCEAIYSKVLTALGEHYGKGKINSLRYWKLRNILFEAYVRCTYENR